MKFFNNVIKAFYNYTDFDGRTGRKEFLHFIIFYLLTNLIFSSIMHFFPNDEDLLTIYILTTILYIVSQVGLFLPLLSISVRRLHDVGKSGWFLLVGIIPVLGTLYLIILCLGNSKNFENNYGSQP